MNRMNTIRDTDQGSSTIGGPEGDFSVAGNAPTITMLLDAVGREVVKVIAAPKGLDKQVRLITLPDTGPGHGSRADSLHLALTTTPGHDFRSVINACESAGAAGLIVRSGVCGADEHEPLEEGGIAILEVEDRVSWPTLFASLAAALAGMGEARALIAPDVAIGDLFGLVNAIAATLGAATTVEDPNRHVLAYSTHPDQIIDDVRTQGILGRQVPDFPGNDATYQAMWRSPRAIRVTSGYPGHRPRLCAAIRVGLEPLGSIWAVEGEEPLGDDALAVLDQAAALAAAHLLRLRNDGGPFDSERSRVTRRILLGDAEPSELRAIGLSPRSGFGVIAYELVDDIHDAAVNRLAGIAQFAGGEANSTIGCVVKADTVIAVLSGDQAPDCSRLRSVATVVATHLRTAMGFPVRAAYRSVGGGLAAVPAAARDVEAALRLMTSGEIEGNVVGCDEVEAVLYLTKLRDNCLDMESTHARVIESLLEYDTEHNSRYFETLNTYLKMAGDVALTSSALMIHRNTLRYRIARLSELFGIDLGNPDERLVLSLQMRFRAL